ncbi:MAG: hypothetical protein M0Q21_05835 [Ignavibacteriaceae bacterium]|nr:hypothetical protein [Ignavibacteriaceae bacterium]
MKENPFGIQYFFTVMLSQQPTYKKPHNHEWIVLHERIPINRDNKDYIIVYDDLFVQRYRLRFR